MILIQFLKDNNIIQTVLNPDTNNNILNLIIKYGLKVIIALITLFIGLKLIKILMNLITKKFIQKKIDISLQSFLISIIKISLYILLAIIILQNFDFEVASIIAILASASFAIGLALQGSLSNFAGGIILLVLKPFKIGDYIEAVDLSGTVSDIQLFYTILNTPDNKKIIIPNANLSNSSTINYSANPTRRVDFVVSSGYNDDIKKVKNILEQIVDNHPLILKDPEYQIVLGEHSASSLNFYLRVWCQTENYWTIYFEVMEKIKNEFDKNNISIPYPQMDIHYNDISKNKI